MRTTVAIDKDIAERAARHGENMGNRSMSSVVEFMLRKSCDLIDAQGYDAFVNIPVSVNQCPIKQEKTISMD